MTQPFDAPDETSLDVPAADAFEQRLPATPGPPAAPDPEELPPPFEESIEEADEADVLEQRAELDEDDLESYPPDS